MDITIQYPDPAYRGGHAFASRARGLKEVKRRYRGEVGVFVLCYCGAGVVVLSQVRT